MATARECDKCGKLFKPVKGCAHIETLCVVDGTKTKTGSVLESTWGDIDFCLDCSREVILAIGRACRGLAKLLPSHNPHIKRRR